MKRRIKNDVPPFMDGHKYMGETHEMWQSKYSPYYFRFKNKGGIEVPVRKEYTEEVKENNMFEVKSGMTFVTKNGRWGFFTVLDSGKVVTHWVGGTRLDTYQGDTSTDITNMFAFQKGGYRDPVDKVFEGLNHNENALFGMSYDSLSRHGKVLWEDTPPVTELTLKEVADKFGIPVEQVRIKDASSVKG